MILRQYQEKAVQRCIKALKEHDNTLLVAATGAGKTVILSEIINRLNAKRTLVMAHRDELTDQNSKTYKGMFPRARVSFFNAQTKSWRGNVTYGMVQTLAQDKNLETIPKIDFFVSDECHHISSDSYRKIIDKVNKDNPNVMILGVTATPERSDKRGLKFVFNNVADDINIDTLVRKGYLVPPRGMVIDIGTQKQLLSVKKTINDYDMAEVEAIQNTDIQNEQVVEHWMNESADRSTLVFCSTIKHSDDVAETFRHAGINAKSVHSKISKPDRLQITEDFKNGSIPVVCNPMLWTEGFDAPICSSVVLLRPSSHKSTMIQMVGRGLRKIDNDKFPGMVKTDCLVMDFGISLIKHGDLISNVRLLDDKESEGEEERTKNCPSCGSEIPIRSSVCPLCGYEFKIEIVGEDDYDEIAEFKMIEVDLMNRSPFRWISLFPGDRVMIASGFNAWVAVTSKDGRNWYAIGSVDKQVKLITISNRIGAISSADDFMRCNESSTSAKKASRWMNEPATEAQKNMLKRFGVVGVMSKIVAAANLTFRFNLKKIESIMEV